MLAGKRILLGVSGSIAAYKSALLTRLLVKEGAEVKIIMTTSALDFITPLTLSTLSRNPVYSTFVKDNSGTWNNHVELGLWADYFIIAPASANTIAKMAHGICDNLLLATYLSARCQVMFAPAMDLDMYQHPATKHNIEKLQQYGNMIISPGYGELASGLVGTGRMAEPEEIIEFLKKKLNHQVAFQNAKVLVTAGPTHEAIDPVRFIGNSSSGKMGYAIAEEVANRGAKVILVSGPTHIKAVHPNIQVLKVTSADEMHAAAISHFPECNIAILSAAVADYKPTIKAEQKIKKKEKNLVIELTKTKDIAAELGRVKRADQYMVGFALETENEIENARKKIQSKNFDFIVLNSLNDTGAGFGHDTNKISILDRNNQITNFNLKSKKEVAADIVNTLEANLHA